MTKPEIRGIWLTTTDSQVLRSRENIAQAMDFLAETGFNVVFPVVWNQGFTAYPSATMQQILGKEINPIFSGRNPLAELVIEAQRVGLKIIPWFEYGFASSYNANGGLLLKSKPEWAARDIQGNLLNKNGFEWLNALDIQVQEFLLNLILEVVNNYDIDGIQGDDRFPALPSEGGYDQKTINKYRQQFAIEPPKNPQDVNWLKWRSDILTNYLEQVYQQIKAVNPNLIVSLSPNIYDWGWREYLQDSPTWLKRNLVDIIHPQIYRRDVGSYKSALNRIVKQQFTPGTLPKLAPGILMKLGNYRINENDLVQILEYNRQLGIGGEVFFFYEGLRENNNQLAKILRQSFYAQPAQFPTLTNLTTVDLPVSTEVNLNLFGFSHNLFQNLLQNIMQFFQRF